MVGACHVRGRKPRLILPIVGRFTSRFETLPAADTIRSILGPSLDPLPLPAHHKSGDVVRPARLPKIRVDPLSQSLAESGTMAFLGCHKEFETLLCLFETTTSHPCRVSGDVHNDTGSFLILLARRNPELCGMM